MKILILLMSMFGCKKTVEPFLNKVKSFEKNIEEHNKNLETMISYLENQDPSKLNDESFNDNLTLKKEMSGLLSKLNLNKERDLFTGFLLSLRELNKKSIECTKNISDNSNNKNEISDLFEKLNESYNKLFDDFGKEMDLIKDPKDKLEVVKRTEKLNNDMRSINNILDSIKAELKK